MGERRQAAQVGAVAAPTTDGQLLPVVLANLLPNPYQPRVTFDEGKLRELAATMERDGYQPIIVCEEQETGDTIIVAGERRARAARDLLGWPTINAIHRGLRGAAWVRRYAMVENLQRVDLNLYEEVVGVMAFAGLDSDEELTNVQIAAELGRSRQHIGKLRKIGRHTNLMSELKVKVEQGEEINLTDYYNRALRVEQMAGTAQQRVLKPRKPAQPASNSGHSQPEDNELPVTFQTLLASSGRQPPASQPASTLPELTGLLGAVIAGLTEEEAAAANPQQAAAFLATVERLQAKARRLLRQRVS